MKVVVATAPGCAVAPGELELRQHTPPHVLSADKVSSRRECKRRGFLLRTEGHSRQASCHLGGQAATTAKG